MNNTMDHVLDLSGTFQAANELRFRQQQAARNHQLAQQEMAMRQQEEARRQQMFMQDQQERTAGQQTNRMFGQMVGFGDQYASDGMGPPQSNPAALDTLAGMNPREGRQMLGDKIGLDQQQLANTRHDQEYQDRRGDVKFGQNMQTEATGRSKMQDAAINDLLLQDHEQRNGPLDENARQQFRQSDPRELMQYLNTRRTLDDQQRGMKMQQKNADEQIQRLESAKQIAMRSYGDNPAVSDHYDQQLRHWYSVKAAADAGVNLPISAMMEGHQARMQMPNPRAQAMEQNDWERVINQQEDVVSAKDDLDMERESAKSILKSELASPEAKKAAREAVTAASEKYKKIRADVRKQVMGQSTAPAGDKMTPVDTSAPTPAPKAADPAAIKAKIAEYAAKGMSREEAVAAARKFFSEKP